MLPLQRLRGQQEGGRREGGAQEPAKHSPAQQSPAQCAPCRTSDVRTSRRSSSAPAAMMSAALLIEVHATRKTRKTSARPTIGREDALRAPRLCPGLLARARLGRCYRL